MTCQLCPTLTLKHRKKLPAAALQLTASHADLELQSKEFWETQSSEAEPADYRSATGSQSSAD